MLTQRLNCKKSHKSKQNTLSPGDWQSREQTVWEASDIYIINIEQGNMIKTLFKNKKPTKKPWKKMHCPEGEIEMLWWRFLWPRGQAGWMNPHPWSSLGRDQVPSTPGQVERNIWPAQAEGFWSSAQSEFETYDWKKAVAFLETEVYLLMA